MLRSLVMRGMCELKAPVAASKIANKAMMAWLEIVAADIMLCFDSYQSLSIM